MALDLQFFPGYKDGDELLSVAQTTDYVGGMALGYFADGVAPDLASADNFAGVALNDRAADESNGKAGTAPRGSKGTLKPSFDPTSEKLIISKGISAGQGSYGESNLSAFAQSLPSYGTSPENPAKTYIDPTAFGATKKYPYDNTKTYAAGELLYVNSTSGTWTNASSDAVASAVAHGQVVKKEGDNLTAIFF